MTQSMRSRIGILMTPSIVAHFVVWVLLSASNQRVGADELSQEGALNDIVVVFRFSGKLFEQAINQSVALMFVHKGTLYIANAIISKESGEADLITFRDSIKIKQ